MSATVRWEDFDRFSSEQRAELKMGGLVGIVHLSGNLAPLVPLLEVGELVHVGKAAISGFGQIRLMRMKAV